METPSFPQWSPAAYGPHRTWYYVGALGLGMLAAVEYAQAADYNQQALDVATSDPARSRVFEDDRDIAAAVALGSGLAAAGLLAWAWWGVDGGGTAAIDSDGWQLRPVIAARDGALGPGWRVERRW